LAVEEPLEIRLKQRSLSVTVRTHDDIKIAPEIIQRMPDPLRGAQNVFDRTGGLHAAALFDLNGELESLREDIGRHNAVDKLIGVALSAPHAAEQLTAFSQRASQFRTRAEDVGGRHSGYGRRRSAPSSLAVATAQRSGMTLVGFAKNSRFNVYAGSRRILGLA
jgi:FdhD protein